MRPFKNRFVDKFADFFSRHSFRIVGKEEDSNSYFSGFSGNLSKRIDCQFENNLDTSAASTNCIKLIYS